MLAAHLGKKDYSIEEVKAIKTEDESLNQAIQIAQNINANGGTFETRRYAYCSSKTFSERACEATKKLHLYLASKFLLQIDTASCLEMAEKLELNVEHQLNRSFYIVVDCEGTPLRSLIQDS